MLSPWQGSTHTLKINSLTHSLSQSLSIRAQAPHGSYWIGPVLCRAEATVPGKRCRHLSRAMCSLNDRVCYDWFRSSKTQDDKDSRVIGFPKILGWQRENNEISLYRITICTNDNKTRFYEYLYKYIYVKNCSKTWLISHLAFFFFFLHIAGKLYFWAIKIHSNLMRIQLECKVALTMKCILAVSVYVLNKIKFSLKALFVDRGLFRIEYNKEPSIIISC